MFYHRSHRDIEIWTIIMFYRRSHRDIEIWTIIMFYLTVFIDHVDYFVLLLIFIIL